MTPVAEQGDDVAADLTNTGGDRPNERNTAMSSVSAEISPMTSDRERARRALLPVGVVTTLVVAFFNVARADSAAEALVVTAVDLVVVGLVLALVVAPGLRHESAGGRGIVLGVVGLLALVPAFWSGLPMVLGAGAVMLGYAGRRASSGSGRAIIALVLGTLSVVGYLAVYVSDWISNPGGSWLG